jgi:glyoxylase-like metal-dependent hydrolase (beta-lactamase superfamily II)
VNAVELVPGVHRIDAEVGGRPLYLFLFLGERRLLLDAGCASTVEEFIVPALAELGLGLADLDVLVVTHSDLDHQGGAGALKQANPSMWVGCGVLDIPLVSDPEALVTRRYQAYVDAHRIGPDERALAWMRAESGSAVRVDLGLCGGELLSLGPGWNLRVLHVPGHSPGHLALFDERSRALFGGDCVQGSVYLGLDGTPKLCPTYTHVEEYLATAAVIESLAPREMHECHWPAARDGSEVAAFLAETRDYVARVDRLVRSSLAVGPLTLAALIAGVNSQLDDPWPDGLAQELVYSVHGHAERLVSSGVASRALGADGRVVYQVSG